ncbi:MAG: glycosyltransferase family 87 protein [Caulobacteraceae bacterium]
MKRILGGVWRIIGPSAWLWELSLVSWLMLASYLLTAHGHLDWTGHALGRDFVNYWTAGHLVVEGRIADIFHPPLFLGHEHRLFDPRLPFHFWSYPPPALFLVAPLGLTSYFTGFGLWSLVGVVLLVPAVRLWVQESRAPGWAVWLIVLAPAVSTNIALGQNGSYTAALMIGGLMLIDKRPRLAGLMFGLLIFKPQIGLLLPVAVLASRRWSVLAVAAATGVAVVVLSGLVFGLDAWRGFFGPTLFTQSLMLKQGHGPFGWMMPSAYMAARVLHLSWPVAMAVQAPFTLASIYIVWRVWSRADVPLYMKAAIVMTATFVASPQGFNYDLIPASGAAALLLWRRDHRIWIGWPLAILAWALPVLMLALESVHAPVAPLILAALLLRLWALTGKPWRSKRRPVRRQLDATETPASA